MSQLPVTLMGDGLYYGDLKPRLRQFNGDFYIMLPDTSNPSIDMYRCFGRGEDRQKDYLISLSGKRFSGYPFGRNLFLAVTSLDESLCREVFDRFKELTRINDFIGIDDPRLRAMLYADESNCFGDFHREDNIPTVFLEARYKKI